jgi:hypothetical protein
VFGQFAIALRLVVHARRVPAEGIRHGSRGRRRDVLAISGSQAAARAARRSRKSVHQSTPYPSAWYSRLARVLGQRRM